MYISQNIYLQSRATSTWFATEVDPSAFGVRAADLMCRAHRFPLIEATGPHFLIVTDLRSWAVVLSPATGCMSVVSHCLETSARLDWSW